MNNSIEDVYLNAIVERHQKVKMASQFQNKNMIKDVPMNRLTNVNADKRHTSNILYELDKVLERKK